MAEYRIELGWKHAAVVAANRMLGRTPHLDHDNYNFHEPRMSAEAFARITTGYVAEHGQKYREELTAGPTTIFSSQYYLFRKIESWLKETSRQSASVLDVGGFYCGPAHEFVTRNSGSRVHAIDLPGVLDLNRDIIGNSLTVEEGYPLQIIEDMAARGDHYDFATFTRTAVLINIEQMREYMAALSKVAENVLFLEVANMQTVPAISIDLRKVGPNSRKLYGGMYLHNYSDLLSRAGYDVKEIYWLSNRSFDQFFSPDHYFVCAWGAKS